MAKSAIKLTVKTPVKTYKVEDYKTQNHIFYEEVENNVARVTLNKLSEAIETANNQTLSIIATFFQRVVSRTPLDEDYLLYTTEEGREVWHRADKNQCRYDWLIDIDGKQVTSGDIKDALGEDVFMQVNNQDCINKIKEYIRNFFGEEADYSIAEIWNVNPHFDVLEYGGYHNQKNDDGTWNDNNWAKKTKSKTGEPYGLKHGVENYHSVQAPVGMLRISQAELLSSSNSKAKSGLSQRYKGQKTQKAITPSDYMLKRFIKQLQGKKISIRDIKRYLGQR